MTDEGGRQERDCQTPLACSGAFRHAERQGGGNVPRTDGGADMATLCETEVIEATESDLQAAMHRALDRAGVTYAELKEQAQTGHFETVEARLAWVAVASLART